MSSSASPVVASFLGKLQGVKQSGTNWYARCPCRADDMNPSLSIGEGRDGRVLATCHRGNPCSLDEICKAMGITHNDLFPKEKEAEVKVPVKAEKLSKNLSLVATYDYRDALGELLFQKQRYVDENGKKTFRQRKPDGEGGWDKHIEGEGKNDKENKDLWNRFEVDDKKPTFVNLDFIRYGKSNRIYF
jgi:hypothetical protein